MGTKKEERVPFPGGVIAALAAAVVLKKQKQIHQKNKASAPVGSKSAMTDAVALRKQNGQAEST